MGERAKCEVKCDRCGAIAIVDAEIRDDDIKPTTQPDGFTKLRYNWWNRDRVSSSQSFYDLCSRCSMVFDNWMKKRDARGMELIDG